MPVKPEKLEAQESSEQEELLLSEQEEAIQDYQEEVDDLNDELPISKEEAEKFCAVMEKAMEEMEKAWRPMDVFLHALKDGIDDAKSAWFLKDDDMERIEEVVKKLSVNLKYDNSLVNKSEDNGEYYLNPDWLFDLVNNNLDKKDRKFVKKTLKAIAKTREKEEKEHIKAEKKELKRVRKIRKEEINKIDS